MTQAHLPRSAIPRGALYGPVRIEFKRNDWHNLAMKIYCVSDVHIKEEEDEASLLFSRFLVRCQEADVVVLLGDIFDLLVGGGKDWFEIFPKTFAQLQKLAVEKPVYYLEGNHDFHLTQLFESLKPIKYLKHDLIIKDQGKLIRFSHGDDVEIDNPAYERYRKIIKSRFIEMLAEEFVPVKYIQAIGQKASQESAKRSKRYEVTSEQKRIVSDKFRRSADAYYNKHQKFDVLVCGHSHVKDCWQSELGFCYVNNGYFMAEKSFAVIENGEVRFELI